MSWNFQFNHQKCHALTPHREQWMGPTLKFLQYVSVCIEIWHGYDVIQKHLAPFTGHRCPACTLALVPCLLIVVSFKIRLIRKLKRNKDEMRRYIEWVCEWSLSIREYIYSILYTTQGKMFPFSTQQYLKHLLPFQCPHVGKNSSIHWLLYGKPSGVLP